jgi:hypothetical protein
VSFARAEAGKSAFFGGNIEKSAKYLKIEFAMLSLLANSTA